MYTQELELARKAVIAASEFCENTRNSMERILSIAKSDKSPVTVADFGSQALINQLIRQQFPGDAMVGEEDAFSLRDPDQSPMVDAILEGLRGWIPDAGPETLFDMIDHGAGEPAPTGRFWTLDPIDGTKGFLRGGQYAVALALIENGQVVLGVLGCPSLSPATLGDCIDRGCLFYAVRGRGASCTSLFQPMDFSLSVSQIDAPADMSFCESVESGHSAHGLSEAIARRLGVTRDPVRLDSQAKYAIVARGEAEAYLRMPTRADYREKIWDHAAGSLIVEESGGRVTDIHGHPLDFSRGRTLENNRGIVATNGLMHDRVIEAIQNVLAAS